MVAIKSIIVLTLSAFAVASPLDMSKSGQRSSGQDSHGEDGHNQSANVQSVHCEKNSYISCCNSKNEGTGGLLGGGLGLNNQCTVLSASGAILGGTLLSGNSKDQKCQDGKLMCCNINDSNSHNNQGFLVVDNSNFGQCFAPEFSGIM